MKVLVFILLAFFSLVVRAEELVAAMADKDYPPFYYYDQTEERWAGISVDVCEHVASSLGYTLSYKRYPFVRLLQHVSLGNADIACTLFNTAQRAPGVTYTALPHAFESTWVFSRIDAADWDQLDIDWLKQFKLGGVRAYFYGKNLEDDDIFKKLLVNNEEQLIKVLLGGRIDYALGNKPSILHHATQMGVADQLRFMEPSVYQGPIYIAISRARDDAHKLAADFTRVVGEFRQSAAYAALIEQYGLEQPQF